MKETEKTLKTISKTTEITPKKNRRKAIQYILSVNILALTISAIVVFSLPRIVHAYSVSRNNRTDYAIDRANALLMDYRFSATAFFEKEEYEIEDFFTIFPAASYPEELSFYYDYEGTYGPYSAAGNAAWAHAYELYYAGKIHGASAGRWCTFFAQMWFYDQFGFNSSGNQATGSGYQFASTIYSTAIYYDEDGNLCHYFEYGDRPMTLGIVSIYNSNNPEGHVLCVDEVDFINGTITVSEGNANGYGDVRIRQTMSLSQFYSLNPGYRVYVNPTPALIEMIKSN